MKTILSDILSHKRQEVERRKKEHPLHTIEKTLETVPPTRSLSQALAASGTGILAEFKRRSPSKGWINQTARIEHVIPDYERHGAAALSILTDCHFFGGSLADLKTARQCSALPILRKEFVVDAYQLYEARAAGADAILLIAAALPASLCRSLAAEAKSIGLEVLLEIHQAGELDAYCPEVSMVGVNNRDLSTFHTDTKRSLLLAESLPPQTVHLSESGLSSPAAINELRQAGYQGFLIGEAFMKCEQPGAALATFTNLSLL